MAAANVEDIDIEVLLENPDIDNRELFNRLDEVVDNESADDLIPITPEDAISRYYRRRRNELAESSMTTHRSSLRHLSRWLAEQGIDNLNELNGRLIQDYLDWRVEEAPTSVDHLAPKSEKTQIDITRKFIEIAEGFNAVPAGLHERIPSFRIKKADEIRDEMLDMERIDDILVHLERYHYASRDHVVWILLSEFGLRIGAIRNPDVDDFSPDERALDLEHRSGTDTPLKNGVESNRSLSFVHDSSVDAIRDYVATNRIDITDEYGRRPLLTTRNGRIGASTIRKVVYRWSCPTAIGEDCVHDDEMHLSEAWSCPENVSPHPVRRGVITHLLRNDTPINIVSDRCDVSPAVIKTHYDGRSAAERREVRRRIITENLDETSA